MITRAKAAHVCILKADGSPAGGGVLVSRRYVVTCAHVAAIGCGEDKEIKEKPINSIDLYFPWREEKRATGHVRFWQQFHSGETNGDLAIIELSKPFDRWANLAEDCTSYLGNDIAVHGHHSNDKNGARIDAVLVEILANQWLQLGGGNREGGYFIAPGASGCGIYRDDNLLGIVAAYEPEPDLREAFAIGAPLIRTALAPLLRAPESRYLRLALGDEFTEARRDFAKGELICSTQQVAKDGRLATYLECGFDESRQGMPRLNEIEFRAILPNETEATGILRCYSTDDVPHVTVKERGKSSPRRPVWRVTASEGQSLCDAKVRCPSPAFIVENAKSGQSIGTELVLYANRGCVIYEDNGCEELLSISKAKQKLMRRLELKKIGDPDEKGAILLCRASRIVEEVSE